MVGLGRPSALLLISGCASPGDGVGGSGEAGGAEGSVEVLGRGLSELDGELGACGLALAARFGLVPDSESGCGVVGTVRLVSLDRK